MSPNMQTDAMRSKFCWSAEECPTCIKQRYRIDIKKIAIKSPKASKNDIIALLYSWIITEKAK